MKVAVLAGDGIGKEVTAEALKVLQAVVPKSAALEISHAPIGGAGVEAAGDPLPGRPTAADLWHDSRPVSAAELLPGDLAFVGAGSGAPHHVGMYVGGGTVVVAPHTGADVRRRVGAREPRH